MRLSMRIHLLKVRVNEHFILFVYDNARQTWLASVLHVDAFPHFHDDAYCGAPFILRIR